MGQLPPISWWKQCCGRHWKEFPFLRSLAGQGLYLGAESLAAEGRLVDLRVHHGVSLLSPSAQGFALSSAGSRRWVCRNQDASSLTYVTNVATRWQDRHVCLSKVSQERGVESHILGSSLFEQIKGRGVKCILLCSAALASAVLLHLSPTWAGPDHQPRGPSPSPDRTPFLLSRIWMTSSTQFQPFMALSDVMKSETLSATIPFGNLTKAINLSSKKNICKS